MIKKKDIIELQHQRNEIKTELATVYITSSGDRYIKEMDALCAESQIQKTREIQEKRRKIIMSMVDILIKILKENNWGVFWKNEPMQTLKLQDDAPLLRINEVDEEAIEGAVLKFIEKLKTKDLTDWTKREIEDTTPPLPTDLNQNNS